MHMRISWPKIAVVVILWALAGCLVLFTAGMPLMQEGSPGPRFLPVVMAIVLAVLAILYGLEQFFSANAESPSSMLPSTPKPYIYVGLAISIIFLWERLGAIATILAVGFALFRLVEGLSWKRSIIAAIFMSAFTYVLFNRILGINLPVGPFGWLLVG